MTVAAPDLVTRIDALLPQTQCRQCSYKGCRPYAEAIAAGKGDINQCPPGDSELIIALASLLNVPVKPLDTRRGRPKPPAVAVIDEALCIGCTLCIKACPVDAIVGAAGLMHTVIARDCTGCELCIPPCSVDCIAMAEIGERTPDERLAAANRARMHYERRLTRLAARPRGRRKIAPTLKQTTIRRAMERAKQRLEQRKRRAGNT